MLAAVKHAARRSAMACACGEAETASAGSNGSAKQYRGNRPLSTSRLNRKGLSSGTVAPPFRLPRVDGGELGLEFGETLGRDGLALLDERTQLARHLREDRQLRRPLRADDEARAQLDDDRRVRPPVHRC